MAQFADAADQSVQAGFTGEARYRLFSSITPTNSIETVSSKPFGSKDVLDVATSKVSSSAAISGDLVQAAELDFFLSSSLGGRTVTTKTADTAAGLVRVTYEPKSFEPAVLKTITAAIGQVGSARRMEKALVNELSLTFDKGAGTSSISGSLLGRALVTDGDFSNSAKLLPAAGLTAADARLGFTTTAPTFANPFAGVSADTVTDAYNWQIGNLIEADYNMDGSGPGPSRYRQSLERTAALSAWVESNDAGRALTDKLLTSERVFASFQTKGGAGSQITILLSTKLSGQDAEEVNSARFGSTVNFQPVYFDTWGGSTKIELLYPALPTA